MIISPHVAIAEGWVDGIQDPEKQIQPNAIDFTVDQLFSIDSDKPFIISEESKTMRGGYEIEVVDGYWKIPARTVVDGLSKIFVNIPEGIACTLIIRSTFNRNGVFLTSGLYDSGYKGSIGFAIHNNSGDMFVAPGTRIGQIKFELSEKAGTYKGGWNHEQGTHWTDSKNGETA